MQNLSDQQEVYITFIDKGQSHRVLKAWKYSGHSLPKGGTLDIVGISFLDFEDYDDLKGDYRPNRLRQHEYTPVLPMDYQYLLKIIKDTMLKDSGIVPEIIFQRP